MSGTSSDGYRVQESNGRSAIGIVDMHSVSHSSTYIDKVRFKLTILSSGRLSSILQLERI